MPQSHGTRRRPPASQRSRSGGRHAQRRGEEFAPPKREAYDPYKDPYGLDHPDEPPLREGRPPRRPRRDRRRLLKVLTSNVTITVVALCALLLGVAFVDLEKLTGQESKPPAADAGLTANDMLAMMTASDIDAGAADAIAFAKKRAFEKEQRELKALREKAKRDAEARRKLKEKQAREAERKRLAASNPSVAQNKAYGKKMSELKGFGGCWSSLETLWEHESGWNERAENPSSGAYGIPQALPGSKMSSSGSDWRTSSPTQIAWGLGYIKARYDTPCGAWSFWQRNNWY